MRKSLLLLLATLCLGCSARKPTSFAIVKSLGGYSLRSPLKTETPIPGTLRAYGFSNADGSVNLQPGIQLRVENAYYEKGLPQRGLAGFLGTEMVRYSPQRSGLRQVEFKSAIPARPDDQPSAANLVPAAQLRFPVHRLFFGVPFRRSGQASGAVLLSAKNPAELDTLAQSLHDNPDATCTKDNGRCTVFPEVCTAAPEIEVFVNGKPRSVIWGNTAVNLFPPGAQPAGIEVKRLFQNKLTPVAIDPADPQALRFPLFPGDRITWPMP